MLQHFAQQYIDLHIDELVARRRRKEGSTEGIGALLPRRASSVCAVRIGPNPCGASSPNNQYEKQYAGVSPAEVASVRFVNTSPVDSSALCGQGIVKATPASAGRGICTLRVH